MHDDKAAVEQLGWVAGVLAPALLLAGFFMIDEGVAASVDEPAMVLAREITDRHDRIVVGSVVGGCSAVLFWGLLGLVTVMSWAAFSQRILPRSLAVVGSALVVGWVALIATPVLSAACRLSSSRIPPLSSTRMSDHGGVSLAMLPWLAVASLLLARRHHTPTPDSARA